MENVKYKGYIVYEDGTIKKDVMFGDDTVREWLDPYGYVYVDIGDSRGQRKHRVVWKAFNGEIDRYTQIDHIDSDRENNALSNLQILSASANSRKAWKSSPNRTSGKQKVAQYTLDGKLVATYNSMREAADAVDGDSRRISEVCNPKYTKDTHRNYK